MRVSDAERRWIGRAWGKILWFLLVCPLMCIGLAFAIGAGVFTVVGAWRLGPGAVNVGEMYGAFVFYSLLVTVPFGSIAGVGAALLIVSLGQGSHRRAGLRRWLRTGVQAGAAVGLTCPLVLATLGFSGGAGEVGWFLGYGLTGSFVGGLVGLGLGLLAWREFGATGGTS